jgi:hypothetical protein
LDVAITLQEILHMLNGYDVCFERTVSE